MAQQENIIYRAYKKYREITNDSSCQREIRAIAKPSEEDVLEIRRYKCIIEEDWITEIEKGLVFVEKALAEERQFITAEGNTVPIEKVKKVSRESVVHLAKHSNLITHVPEDESKPVIPDSIYMVEKLSDYTVYENRFLYMLLLQLKEFVSMRHDKITKLRRRYICKFNFSNKLATKLRNYNTKIEFYEDRLDNPYPIDDNISKDLITRIEDIERMIITFLKTNIMIDVSKAQLIKPPIVKTNVLKMNNNFKRSLELYDYISAYKKEGFSYEEIVTNYAPFSVDVEEEFSELSLLISNLTSKYGNDITKLLELNYQNEEEELKRLEAKKLLEQIERVKRKIKESNQGYEEYILLVEKRNKYLESANEKLIISENKVIELNKKVLELDSEISELNRKIVSLDKILDEKNNEIIDLTKEAEFKINKLKDEHALDIQQLNEEFEGNLVEERKKIEIEVEAKYEDIRQELHDKVDEINNLKYDIENLKAEQEEKLNEKTEEYQLLYDSLKEKEAMFKDDLNSAESQYKQMLEDVNNLNNIEKNKYEEEINGLKDKLGICLAELHACKTQLNMEINDDFTTREGFAQLENEFNYFYKFFKQEWKKTKKNIRRQLLWTKRQAKEKKNNSEEIN